ncbi:MAG: hypothetical protein K2X69_09240 [Silvanigrellaceae bacterium]|nr:hypothetical protein [Silvanigrellaceae bacterium]
MTLCTLDKDTKYLVNDVLYNGKGYKLILSENPETCKDGIFYSKKLAVTVDENANIPSLKFNMEQGVPELKISNTALIKHENFIAKENKSKDFAITLLLIALFLGIAFIVIQIILLYDKKKIKANENTSKGFFKKKEVKSKDNYQTDPIDTYSYTTRRTSSPSFSSQVCSSVVGNVVGNSIYNSITHNEDTHKPYSSSSYSSDSYSSSSYSSDYDSSSSYSSDSSSSSYSSD